MPFVEDRGLRSDRSFLWNLYAVGKCLSSSGDTVIVNLVNLCRGKLSVDCDK